MNPIIAHMKRLPIDINNREPVVPLIDRKICRMKFTKAPDRISRGDLTVHVALGVFTRLMVMALHGTHLTPQEQAPGNVNR